MRHSRESPSPGSGTPIYDALYAEYSRLFRTLPGDRSGEEELRFEGFGLTHGTAAGQLGGGNWRGGEWPHELLPKRTGGKPAALPPGQQNGRTYGR